MAGRVTGRCGAVALLLTVFLAGCAAAIFGATGTEGERHVGDGPSKLRIAVFEPKRPLLVPHAAIIIHAPDGHLIYDPAGWTPDARGHRRADVIHSATPETEEAFLMRQMLPGLSAALPSVGQPEGWELFLFEANVSDAVALRAAQLARERPALPMSGCAFGVSTLLRQVPGFEDIRPCWLPATLRQSLEARDDLTLTRTLVPPAQGG